MWLVAVILDSRLFINQEGRSKMLSLLNTKWHQLPHVSLDLTWSLVCHSLQSHMMCSEGVMKLNGKRRMSHFPPPSGNQDQISLAGSQYHSTMKPKLCLELLTITTSPPSTTSSFKYVYLNHTLTTVWLLRVGWEGRTLPLQSVLYQRQGDIF